MTKKVFHSIMAVSLLVLLAAFLIASSFLYGYFNRLQADRLKEELTLAEIGVEQEGAAFLEPLRSSVFRFTLVSPDGSVLFDSQTEPDAMENHLGREEIAEALKTGHGSSARYSTTLTERTFYEAVRLSNGSVLRISATQITVGAMLVKLAPAAFAVLLFSLLMAFFLSRRMTGSIVKPLEKLNLDAPEQNDTYEELAPILTRLNKQHRQITDQLRELERKSDEFRQITSSMKEGLLLLDPSGLLLFVNDAAKELFHIGEDAVGRHFLTVDRTPAMRHAVEEALGGDHSEFREERNGGEYRFLISKTESGGTVLGLVILCLDVTETALAEKSRKEFTANVSHELKTPLQSIIGSAELLENGLVKPEDTARFVGNIKREATRLVGLINDIIRLSQLDENQCLQGETADLSEIVREAAAALADAAGRRGITVTAETVPCPMHGVRHYLYEVVYNLCDNAIRYNRDGGRVELRTETDGKTVTLSVCDTGIGIPPEHQARVFERFYRVDKSHSRETGGTGLGLSIVKHAVAYHGGTIRLSSVPGEGTTVTVSFPAAPVQNETKK